MTDLHVSYVDVYVVRRRDDLLELLALRRGPDGRSPGSWETVHGHLEPGERPEEGARRELAEETGLVPERWYNLSRVELFYRHQADAIALIPVFAALVPGESQVRLSPEHDRAEWLPAEAAKSRFSWPRERRAVDDLLILLGPGHAGPVEDVLRLF